MVNAASSCFIFIKQDDAGYSPNLSLAIAMMVGN